MIIREIHWCIKYLMLTLRAQMIPIIRSEFQILLRASALIQRVLFIKLLRPQTTAKNYWIFKLNVRILGIQRHLNNLQHMQRVRAAIFQLYQI